MEFAAIESQNMSLMKFFRIKKIPSGIYPLLGIMTFAVSGASYFAYHCLSGPEIQLHKNRESANMHLMRDETTKLWNPNGRFQSYWGRQF
jgi:hypothetical protein